jgi:hypothetical protein
MSPRPDPDDEPETPPPPPDHYVERGLLVYTATYHLKRGHCCGSGCRHCPYEPKHVTGNTNIRR